MTYCSICGKLLTDPVSVSRGIGPECIMNVKNDTVGQGTLFASRAKYDYRIRYDVLMITDLGGARSLTNDMEVVLREIEHTEGDIYQLKIMYKDSFGQWDGVVFTNGRAKFFFIGETDQAVALKVLDKKWKYQYTTQS